MVLDPISSAMYMVWFRRKRLDLSLSGVDDGLNSFGQGIWMFHDHVEKSFTTDGHGEAVILAWSSTKVLWWQRYSFSTWHELGTYFAKSLWQGKYPIWQDYDAFRSLGLPDLQAEVTPSKVAVQTVAVKASDVAIAAAQQQGSSALAKLFYGLVMGLLGYTAVVKRRQIIDFSRKLIDIVRSKLVKK